MAIYIIDQFSLNTDLPLDIRYVPDGGSYNDVSAYWYPGMQVYQTSDETIWYADNSLNWHQMGSSADASINDLYDLINQLDSSIGDLYNITNVLEASINRIDVSLNDYGLRIELLENSVGYLTDWNASQDASIVDLRGQISDNDASLNDLYDWQVSQDASIDDLRTKDTQIDASLNDLYDWQAIQDTSILYNDSSIQQLFGLLGDNDASIDDLYDWQVSQDASIDDLRTKDTQIDASLNDLYDWQVVQDTSIVANQDAIADIEASLGDYVRRDGDTMTGDLTVPGLVVQNDVSVSGDSVFVGDVQIGGDLTVDGSTTIVNSDIMDISTNFIYLNTGLTGQPPSWLQSGIVVERGDASAYAVIFDETDNTFRVGVVWNPDASGVYQDTMTKPVATREDNPIDTGVPFWHSLGSNNGYFDTDSTLTYTAADGLKLDSSLRLTSYAGSQDLQLVVGTDGYVKAVPTADASINDLYDYIDGSLVQRDSSITELYNWQVIQDGSIITLQNRMDVVDSSITSLTQWQVVQDNSIAALDSSVSDLISWNEDQDASIDSLFARQDTSVLGAMNIGDGSAAVYAGLTNDGSLQFREFIGVGAATVTQNGDLIEIGIDASFGGEVNTASNIGTGEGVFGQKVGQDLEFKSIDTNDPSTVIISSDSSTIYIDVSVAPQSDASLSGLTDTSINDASLVTHQIVEYDGSLGKWTNTNGILWDTSLGTTTDDLGGIPQGTNLEGKTLKEILYRILYEYQVPNLDASTNPVGGIYEKGLASTQFSSITIGYDANTNDYPLAKLNNISITKTGSGSIYDASLGLVSSASGSYTDSTGITNWGGTNRTINYNVYISDDQADQDQPAVSLQAGSFTFYYRQYWGIVDGGTTTGDVDSTMIKGLSDSRLAGETDLNATFDNSTGAWVKYLFAYPDTVASPDNFGLLSEIKDQNGYDITDSFDTENEDVSVGSSNIRYRFYLLSRKVRTSTFDITFKF